MKKGKIILLAVIVALLSVVTYLHMNQYEPLVQYVTKKQIEKILSYEKIEKENLKVLFCGTGSPNRSPERGQPCIAVLAGQDLFLFDAGEGAILNLRQYGAPVSRLKKIFLTHLHSDHISGVAEVMHNSWLFGRRYELEVVGPPGTVEMLSGMRTLYNEDLSERERTLGKEYTERDVIFRRGKEVAIDNEDLVVVHDSNGVRISAFAVDHKSWHHAYGYKIEYKGKSIVISGDTSRSENLIQHAKNADLLIHEVLNERMLHFIGAQLDEMGGPLPADHRQKIIDCHTDTLVVADIARQANVKLLALNHFIPSVPPNRIAEMYFTAGMDEIYNGRIIPARDGQWLDLLE